MGNDIEITVRVSNQTAAGSTQVTAAMNRLRASATQAGQALRTTEQRAGQAGHAVVTLGRRADTTATAMATLQARARAAGQGLNAMTSKADHARRALTELRAAAGDIRVRAAVDDRTDAEFAAITARLYDLRAASARIAVTVDDQTGPGIASARAALDGLRASSAEVPVTIRDRTGPGAASVTRALDRLKARGAQITVGIKDKTQAGIAGVRTGVQSLRALSPVDIDIRFSGQTGEITAAAQAMRSLRTRAQAAATAVAGITPRATAAAAALTLMEQAADGASRALRTLRGRAAAAAVALGDVRDRAAAAARALRQLDSRASGANTRLGDLGDRTRRLRGDMDDLDGAVQRVAGGLGGLRGRIGTVSGSSGQAASAAGRWRGALAGLATAVLPVAAATVPLVQGLTAGAGALAAFGAAVLPQITRMGEAVQAQTKYAEAVRKGGAASKEAITAGQAVADAVARMSPATREATAGFMALKDATGKWSNSLSGSTMPLFTKSFATLRGMLPSFTPLVQGAAAQLDRFVTIAAGGVGSGAFDELMTRFAEFSSGALRRAVDGLVHLSRTFDGFSGGAFSEFMAYARENGPAVGETLRALGSAAVHLLASMGDLGVSMLTVVNAAAKLVNALPTEFISTVLQAYAAFKLFGLAAAGVMALGVALRTATRALVTFRAAAVTAGGGVAGLRAAFLGLSAAAKTTVIVAGLTAVVMVLSKLSSIGKSTPPDVDLLTGALARLGRSGKASGEAARLFGNDLGGLYDKVRSLTDPSTADKVQQFLVGWTGFDSTPVKDAKKAFDGVDEALASMVKGGKADLAAAALERLKKAYSGKDGHSAKEFTKGLDGYKSALADAAFEQELAADAMGLFGRQAQATGEKLAAQKASADGLRQAIQALNDVNRAALGGMIGFEAAIDTAAKAARDNAGALSMSHGRLDLNNEKARNAASALADLAARTEEAAAAARESGSSWETVSGIYERGRSQLVKWAQVAGLSRKEAERFAKSVLNMKGFKKVEFRGSLEDLERALKSAQRKVDSLKQRRKTALGADKRQLDGQVAAAQRRVNSIVQRRLAKLMAQDRTGAAVRSALAQMSRVQNKTVYINSVYTYSNMKNFRAAHGRATGGPVVGPGSGTSDDVPIMASNGEFVVRAAAVRKYGQRFMDAVNSGGLELPKFARGGSVKAARAAEKEARRGMVGDLTISRFGQMAGYQRPELRSALAKPSDIGGLVDTLNGWRSKIKAATSGGVERRLLRSLDAAGRSLLKNAKAHDKVSDQLDKAKTKLSDLRASLSQMRDSVASGITGSANIARLSGGDDGRGQTVADIVGGLVESRDKATSFAGALKDLKRRGLSKELLAQLGEAGIEGGGLKTAETLADASGSEIRRMNALRSQIATAAKAAGTTTADAMYGAGIKAAEGVVKGLEKNKKRLERAMDDVAKALVNAIKKATGVKGKAAGGVTGAAGGGPRSGLTLVGEQGWELLDLPAGSRVRTHGDSRRMLAAASGGGGGVQRPIELVVNLDGRTVARQLVDPLRSEIWDRSGGNVQKALGR